MNRLTILVDGRSVAVTRGTTVAAALWNAGVHGFRRSVNGSARGPICAMGICWECRVTIDGEPHRRACMELCAEGMEIETGAG